VGFGYPQIVEERVNGTLLIFLQGEGKLRLGKVLDKGTPYLVCEGEIIPESTSVEQNQQNALNGLYRTLTRWINTHIPDQNQREIFMKNITRPEEVVGSFASYLVRDYDLQQMVLEYDNINEKIRFLQRLQESNELTL
jgi:ATP-dependent Lon protease